MVSGNHDGEVTKSLGWESVRDVAYETIESTKCVICHYPWASWPGSRKPTTLMLYGHHHGKILGNRQSADIGVDVMGIAPVRLATIKAYMATLPPRVDRQGDEIENNGVTP